MCRSTYQYGLARKAEQEEILVKDEEVREWIARGHFNICPTQQIFAVRHEDEGWIGSLMRFGIRQATRPQPLINSRDDTMQKNPGWFGSFQRVLMPVSGFYEWPMLGGRKRTYAIRPETHDDHWWFAGLMKVHEGEGQVSIMTVDPTPYMRELHSRWPLILHPKDRGIWLDPATPRAVLFNLMKPPPDEWADAYEIGPDAGNWKNDYPELLHPVA